MQLNWTPCPTKKVFDMVNIIAYINKLEEEIALANGYNEYYREYKTKEEYLKCKEDIELMEMELKKAKKVLNFYFQEKTDTFKGDARNIKASTTSWLKNN